MIKLAETNEDTTTEDTTTDTAPGLLLALAEYIEGNPRTQEAIAAAFRLIAAMWTAEAEQGTELGAAEKPATIATEDNPATGAGADLVDTATGPGLEGVR